MILIIITIIVKIIMIIIIITIIITIIIIIITIIITVRVKCWSRRRTPTATNTELSVTYNGPKPADITKNSTSDTAWVLHAPLKRLIHHIILICIICTIAVCLFCSLLLCLFIYVSMYFIYHLSIYYLSIYLSICLLIFSMCKALLNCYFVISSYWILHSASGFPEKQCYIQS